MKTNTLFITFASVCQFRNLISLQIPLLSQFIYVGSGLIRRKFCKHETIVNLYPFSTIQGVPRRGSLRTLSSVWACREILHLFLKTHKTEKHLFYIGPVYNDKRFSKIIERFIFMIFSKSTRFTKLIFLKTMTGRLSTFDFRFSLVPRDFQYIFLVRK